MDKNILIKFTADTGGLDEATQKLDALGDREKELLKQIELLKREQQAAQMMAKNADEQTKATKKYGEKVADARKELVQTRKSIEEVSAAQKELEKTVAKGTIEKSFRTIRMELQEQLRQMRLNGQAGTEEYNKLIAKLSEMNRTQMAVNAEMKSQSSITYTFDSIMKGAQLATGAYTTLTAAQAIFGTENKDLQKTMATLQTAMTASMGVQQLYTATVGAGGVIQRVMTLQTKARTAAELMSTKGTIGATIAQKAFNIVANANPYVLLATALITVVGALYLFASRSKDAEKAQERLNRRMEDFKKFSESAASSVSGQIVTYKKLQSQWNALGNDLDKKKKFIVQNKDAFHDLGFEVNNVADIENILIGNTDKVIDAMKLRAQATASQELAIEKYKEALIKQQEAQKIQQQLDERVAEGGYKKTEEGYVIEVDLMWGGKTSYKAYTKDLEDGIQEAKDASSELMDEFDSFFLNMENKTKESNMVLGSAGIEAYEKAGKTIKDNAQKYMKDISWMLREEHLKAIKDDEAREVLGVKQQYEKKFAEIKGESVQETALRKQLEENMQADIQKVHDKYDKQELDAQLQVEKTLSDSRLALLKEGSEEYIRERENNLRILSGIEAANVMNSTDEEKVKSAKLLEINNKLTADLKALWNDYYKDYAEKSIEDVENTANQQALAVTQQYEQGKLSKWKYEASLNQITISSLEKEIAERKKHGEDTVDLEKELSDKRKEIALEEAEYRKQVTEEAFNLMVSIQSSMYDRQKEELNQRLNDLNYYYTTDAEEAKKNADKKYISERELKKRQLEIKRELAAVEKKEALFNATVNMAQGITKALASAPPPYNAILAAITVAAALVQINAIQSKQIPAYEKGRKTGIGEFALIGEKGPEIMWVPNRAAIMPAHDTQRALSGDMSVMSKWNMPQMRLPRIEPNYIPPTPHIPQYMIDETRKSAGNKGVEIDYDKLGRAVAKYNDYNKFGKAVARNQKKVNISFDKDGLTVTRGNKTTHYLNARGKV